LAACLRQPAAASGGAWPPPPGCAAAAISAMISDSMRNIGDPLLRQNACPGRRCSLGSRSERPADVETLVPGVEFRSVLIFRVWLISSSVLASSRTKSAILPFSIVPRSRFPRNCAGLIVAGHQLR